MVFRPFFKVEGITAKEFRQQKINILDYSAVVFTSRHAVDNYFKLAKEMRITIPEDMKYFCVIETIALYIQNTSNTASARSSLARRARLRTLSRLW